MFYRFKHIQKLRLWASYHKLKLKTTNVRTICCSFVRNIKNNISYITGDLGVRYQLIASDGSKFFLLLKTWTKRNSDVVQ